MNERSKAASVGLFIVIMLALLIAMLLTVSNGRLLGQTRLQYELVYDTSIKGLGVGAPVTLRGVQIGEVASIKTRFYSNLLEPLNAVVINIYPDQIEVDGLIDDEIGEELIDVLSAKGLSAKLRSQSLLTGLLYIEIDFYSETPRKIKVETDHPQLQTVPSDLERLDSELGELDLAAMVDDMQQILANVNKFTSSSQFQRLAYNMNKSLKAVEEGARKTGESADAAGARTSAASEEMRLLASELRAQLKVTSSEISGTMEGVERMVGEVSDAAGSVGAHLAPDSPLSFELNRVLQNVSRAAGAVERFADMLEQQPNSVLAGKRDVNQ